jgi:transposase
MLIWGATADCSVNASTGSYGTALSHGYIKANWSQPYRAAYARSLAAAELPDDPAALLAFALACQSELKAAETAVQLKALEIEKLRFQIAKLGRMQFGRSSERITRQIAQLEFQLEELETGAAEDAARAEATEPSASASPRANKPKRKPLPDHLPRQDVVHQPPGDGACSCP